MYVGKKFTEGERKGETEAYEVLVPLLICTILSDMCESHLAL
jgi:hypothetical protein